MIILIHLTFSGRVKWTKVKVLWKQKSHSECIVKKKQKLLRSHVTLFPFFSRTLRILWINLIIKSFSINSWRTMKQYPWRYSVKNKQNKNNKNQYLRNSQRLIRCYSGILVFWYTLVFLRNLPDTTANLYWIH